MSQPLVSVCIVAYQHSRFIGKAIDGALMQKTNFPVEILVGEDESTDGTREISQDYARRHPDRVKVFLRRRSDVVFIDGHPRGSHNLNETIRAARGEFVALCEGDDYWTAPDKLQVQVDYLRANPDCVACFHDTALVDADGNTLKSSYFQSTRSKFDRRDVLETLMSNFATCSLLFRRAAYFPLPCWFLRRPCDLYLDVHLTASGKLGFIDRCLGAYRRHGGGIWSSQRESNQIVELIIRYKLLLADSNFLANYRDLLLRKIDEFQALLFTRADGKAELVRLQGIVEEQSVALAATQAECERLTKVAQQAQHDRDRVVGESQGYVDSLKLQLDGVAASIQTQSRYIASLESERDGLVAALNGAARTADLRYAELAAQTTALRGQLDALAATSRTQDEYIKILEGERDRLTALCSKLQQDCTHYVAVMKQQNEYIASLESERTK